MTTYTAWKPKHDQVIVRPLEAAERRAGGLIVTPDAHRERPQRGIVLAVGPRVTITAITDGARALRPGDMVAFGKWAGVEFEDPASGLTLLVMREVECILGREEGSFQIVEHDTPSGKRVIHEAGEVCEFCPTPGLDAERARLRLAAAADLELGGVSGEGVTGTDRP